MSWQKSLKVSRRVVVYVGILAVALAGQAQAMRPIGNTTPSYNTCRVIIPLAFRLYHPADGMNYTKLSITTEDGQGEGYEYFEYLDDERSNTPDARVSRFTLRTGVRLWQSHSGAGRYIEMEAYTSASKRNDAYQAYIESGEWTVLRIEKQDFGDMYYIRLTAFGVKMSVKPVDDECGTITFSGGCSGDNLADDFGGREHFGYDGTTRSSKVDHDVRVLWDCMTGIRGNGDLRPAGTAYAAGLPHTAALATFVAGRFSGPWDGTDGRLYRRENGGDDDGKTVLTPTVAETFPQDDVWEGCEGWVQFDAYMNKATDLEDLLTIVEGSATLSDIAWNEDGTRVSFTVNNVVDGARVGFKIDWTEAYDVSEAHFLNGNTDSLGYEGGSGLRPNKDDYTWASVGQLPHEHVTICTTSAYAGLAEQQFRVVQGTTVIQDGLRWDADECRWEWFWKWTWGHGDFELEVRDSSGVWQTVKRFTVVENWRSYELDVDEQMEFFSFGWLPASHSVEWQTAGADQHGATENDQSITLSWPTPGFRTVTAKRKNAEGVVLQEKRFYVWVVESGAARSADAPAQEPSPTPSLPDEQPLLWLDELIQIFAPKPPELCPDEDCPDDGQP